MAVIGLIIGVFGAVVFGAIKLGWKYAPWIVGIAFFSVSNPILWLTSKCFGVIV
jgi:hypothetical protein